MGNREFHVTQHVECKCKDCKRRFTLFLNEDASPFDPLKHSVCPHCGSESYWIINKKQKPGNGE